MLRWRMHGGQFIQVFKPLLLYRKIKRIIPKLCEK